MKLRILLSILFFIGTASAAVHEVQHITLDDSSSCLVCNINDNLTSADVIVKVTDIIPVHFEEIIQDNFISKLHVKEKNNQNRAPPKLS